MTPERCSLCGLMHTPVMVNGIKLIPCPMVREGEFHMIQPCTEMRRHFDQEAEQQDRIRAVADRFLDYITTRYMNCIRDVQKQSAIATAEWLDTEETC